MIASCSISSAESERIDRILDNAPVIDHDESKLDPMKEQSMIGQFCASLGATNAHLDHILFPGYEIPPPLEPILESEVDWDTYMASSTQASASKGVTAEYLSKVWRIDIDDAAMSIKANTQRCVRSTGADLNRNYSTNDRMLRYKRIHQHFFMDTFFATKKAGKSTRGHTCMQLFVTDKGFVYVIPMASKSEVNKAVKLFAKEIGAPDAIVCDAAP
jgi:hypothetical protein